MFFVVLVIKVGWARSFSADVRKIFERDRTMRKIVFLASLVAISVNVFASPEGLAQLHKTDSSRFQLGMRDISDAQMKELSLPQRLRKCEKVIYVQSDSWPQEKDDSQDFDYIPSQNIKYGFKEENPDSFVADSRELIEQLPEKEEERVDNSVEDIFEDVLAPYEFGSCRYNLRNRQKVIYVQPSGSGYSQFPEQDNSQDSDYIPSQNVNGLEEANSVGFVRDNRGLTEQLQEVDLIQPFSSPNKKLKLSLNRNYYDKKLNLINNKDFLKKYRNFDNVESLVLTAEDLKDANKFKFSNLKKLNIDILIKPKKGNLKQLFAAEKRRSRINKKKSINQLLSEELRSLLLKNPNLEEFSIQHTDCKDIPMEIWLLKELKSLTLKMTGMTELSSNVQNLVNLETLDLSNNKIKALPEELSKLNSLKELNLVGNYLMKEFPNTIEQLSSLEQLHVDKNQANLWKKQLQNLKKTNKNLKIEEW